MFDIKTVFEALWLSAVLPRVGIPSGFFAMGVIRMEGIIALKKATPCGVALY
jgi:hypothetical protein